MLNTPETLRVLRPKITPQAAARMYLQHATGIAVTTATLGLVWWSTFFQTWADVFAPDGGRHE